MRSHLWQKNNRRLFRPYIALQIAVYFSPSTTRDVCIAVYYPNNFSINEQINVMLIPPNSLDHYFLPGTLYSSSTSIGEQIEHLINRFGTIIFRPSLSITNLFQHGLDFRSWHLITCSDIVKDAFNSFSRDQAWAR